MPGIDRSSWSTLYGGPVQSIGSVAATVLVMAMSLAVGGCSGEDEPSRNQITRIDGPATVDDDAGADQAG